MQPSPARVSVCLCLPATGGEVSVRRGGDVSCRASGIRRQQGWVEGAPRDIGPTDWRESLSMLRETRGVRAVSSFSL
jgi:hypothetical protein